LTVPDTLEKKLELFRKRGYFLRYRWEMFHPASWLAIYTGFDILPESYDPAVDSFPADYVSKSLAEMKASIRRAVDEAPGHQDFIDSL
jgi:tryptophan halogenase